MSNTNTWYSPLSTEQISAEEIRVEGARVEGARLDEVSADKDHPDKNSLKHLTKEMADNVGMIASNEDQIARLTMEIARLTMENNLRMISVRDLNKQITDILTQQTPPKIE
jgi:hypothetical protein